MYIYGIFLAFLRKEKHYVYWNMKGDAKDSRGGCDI